MQPRTVSVLNSIPEIAAAVKDARRAGRSIGLVPTMGNLHAGHRSLIERARAETDFVVVTIFVNPIQFGPNEDFRRYPRTLDADLEVCRQAGADVVFQPAVEVMYPPGSCTRVQVVGLDGPLCGKSRPGHFVGVATVVCKLFNLVPADVAFFGQKDFQQTRVIGQMVADLNFPIEIRVCPIVREADGLAMSSRNSYLSAEERVAATVLNRSLLAAQQLVQQGKRQAKQIRQEMLKLLSIDPLAAVDYIEIVDPQTLLPLDTIGDGAVIALAAWFGKTRLIDNIILRV